MRTRAGKFRLNAHDHVLPQGSSHIEIIRVGTVYVQSIFTTNSCFPLHYVADSMRTAMEEQ